jgi:hypothetical protein
MFFLDTVDKWSVWLHLLALLDHLFILKGLFFVITALVYIILWIIKALLGESSENWSNAEKITEKIGTYIGRVIFFLMIAFIIFQVIHMLLDRQKPSDNNNPKTYTTRIGQISTSLHATRPTPRIIRSDLRSCDPPPSREGAAYAAPRSSIILATRFL